MAYVDPNGIGCYGSERNGTRWVPTEILYNGGPGGWSAVEGTYGGEPRLGLRWNGDVGRPSFPTSRRAVWFTVPTELEELVRDAVRLGLLGLPQGGAPV